MTEPDTSHNASGDGPLPGSPPGGQGGNRIMVSSFVSLSKFRLDIIVIINNSNYSDYFSRMFTFHPQHSVHPLCIRPPKDTLNQQCLFTLTSSILMKPHP